MKSIFISSTFKDMQSERDLLQLDILPEIRSYLNKYGENINFIDLRWGVDTSNLESDEGSKKVLSVCLDQIDTCKPYMIVLLGERYGWIPNPHLIKEAEESKNIVSDKENLEKSVTALEIEYGAFNLENIDKERCFFYIREPLDYSIIPEEYREIYKVESKLHEEKLKQLKEDVRKYFPDNIRTYSATWDSETNQLSDLDSLRKQVEKDIKALIDEEYKDVEVKTWQDKEILEDKRIIEEKSNLFTSRKGLLKSIIKSTLRNNLVILRGSAGVGKSTIIAKLATELEKRDQIVLTSVCGNSSYSSNISDILLQLIYEIENVLGVPEHFELNDLESSGDKDIQVLKLKLQDLLFDLRLKTDKPIDIIIDAIDQLNPDESIDNFSFLPFILPENITFIISCLDILPIPNNLPIENKEIIEIGTLSKDEIEEISKSILKSNAKEIDQSVIELIKEKKEASNPLYLELLLEQLLLFNSHDFEEIKNRGDGIEIINRYLGETVKNSPNTLKEMTVYFLNNIIQRINPEQSKAIIDLISVSRHGLREQDLEGILNSQGINWDSLDFAHLQKYLFHVFTQRDDGRVDFAHRITRESLKESFDKKDYLKLNNAISDWLKDLNNEDLFKLHENYYHLQESDRQDEAIEFINQINSLENFGTEIVSKEIYESFRNNNLPWFKNLYETKDLGYDFINFFMNYLYPNFTSDRKDVENLNELFEENIILTQQLKKNYNEPTLNIYLIEEFIEYGLIKLKQYNLYDAYFYINAGLELLKELDINSEKSNILEAKAYEALAFISEKQKHYKDAKKYQLRAKELYFKINCEHSLSWSSKIVTLDLNKFLISSYLKEADYYCKNEDDYSYKKHKQNV